MLTNIIRETGFQALYPSCAVGGTPLTTSADNSKVGRRRGILKARPPKGGTSEAGFQARAALHLAPAVDGTGERRLVGVLELATHRDAGGDPRGPHPERAEQLGQIDGGRLPLDPGAGRQDGLEDRPV